MSEGREIEQKEGKIPFLNLLAVCFWGASGYQSAARNLGVPYQYVINSPLK